MSRSDVSRWAHYKIIRAPRYLALCVLVLAIFVGLSIIHQDWSYFPRSGAFIALFGALLGLRKLLRKGARDMDEPNDPLVINGNQFNTEGMWQRVQDLSDSFAQELGLVLVVAGTLINGFGDLVLEALVPFSK